MSAQLLCEKTEFDAIVEEQHARLSDAVFQKR